MTQKAENVDLPRLLAFGGSLLSLILLVISIASNLVAEESLPHYTCDAFLIGFGLSAVRTAASLILLAVIGAWKVSLLPDLQGLLVSGFLGNYFATVNVRR